MTRPFTHDEAFDRLDALVFDAVDDAERRALLDHVGVCDVCRAELAELREAASSIAFAAPAAESAGAHRDRIRTRLMARAAADADVPRLDERLGSSAAVALPPVNKAGRSAASAMAWRRAEWVSIAAGILLVISVSMLVATMRDRDNLRAALTDQIARGRRAVTSTDSLRAVAMAKDSIIAGLTGRDVAMMTLTAAGTRAPFAHMFWDKTRNTWTMVAHNMPDLKPGRTYQLWLVTPDKKISAGTFEPRDGDAMVRATYPLTDKLMALAVTEEPAGGMPQPTGSMVMIANAQ